MTYDMTNAHEAAWQSRPLCCRYLFANFGAQRIRVRADDVTSTFSVSWGLGALEDGHLEVLGSWADPIADAPNWQAVFSQLAARGVQQIRFVVNADSEAVRAAFPRSRMLNSMTLQPCPDLAPSAALSPRVRRIVKSTAGAAQQMQAALTHVVRRHGSFDCPKSALMALEQALQRLEQRLWERPAVSQFAALRQSATTAVVPAA